MRPRGATPTPGGAARAAGLAKKLRYTAHLLLPRWARAASRSPACGLADWGATEGTCRQATGPVRVGVPLVGPGFTSRSRERHQGGVDDVAGVDAGVVV